MWRAAQAMSEQIIKGIWGAEPRREGEFPECHMVGSSGVTSIVRREENLGTYGIVWFDVLKDGAVACSMNAIHVASVQYADGAP